MLSSMLIIPLIYIPIFITLVQAHELPLHRRDHASIGKKRFLKNRSPLDLLGTPVANAASLPASSDSQIATPTVSQSTVSDTASKTISSLTSASASTSASTSTGTTSTITSSGGTSTTSSSTSSSTSNTSSSSSKSTSKSSASLILTSIPATPTLNIVASTITSTQPLSATPSDTTVPQLQSASAKTKTTTVTVLIAIAASVGGIAILWTIFRKWKLSSSKEFDRRLNPITDWQPTGAEDDIIPALRRAPSSASSFHSGGGHSPSRSAGYGNERGLAPPEHDFTAGPSNSAPIGGYADLSRTSSPNPPMQQALGRGPSLNHGYDYGVPLHHQTGYNTHDAYDYNAAGVRY